MKNLIIDSRLRSFEKNYLINLGYNLIEVPISKKTYFEIAAHVDIFATKLNDTLILEPSIYERLRKSLNTKAICGIEKIGSKYPEDIKYNVCSIGKNVIHNFKYTDKKILEYIEKNNLKKININQGYSKCSICVVDSNSAIVTDKKIANELKRNGIDVLYINDKLDIKLYKDEKRNYSKMNGFIGGAISRLKDKIIVFGNLQKIDKENKIKEFITSKNIEIIDFENEDVIDYGGIIEIE